ncbi:hypothetical protein AB0L81_35505, partial [Streptomyces sp. NPDC052127]
LHGVSGSPSAPDPEAVGAVLTGLDDDDAQRWLTDAASATPGSLAVTGTDAPASAQPVDLADGTA